MKVGVVKAIPCHRVPHRRWDLKMPAIRNKMGNALASGRTRNLPLAIAPSTSRSAYLPVETDIGQSPGYDLRVPAGDPQDVSTNDSEPGIHHHSCTRFPKRLAEQMCASNRQVN